MDRNQIRERYMRDNLSIRMGGIAANLLRIKSFSDHSGHRDVVAKLLDESKYFIEWTAPETDMSVAAELVKLQIRLAQWQYKWDDIWNVSDERQKVADEAEQWSKRILKLSGLLR